MMIKQVVLKEMLYQKSRIIISDDKKENYINHACEKKTKVYNRICEKKRVAEMLETLDDSKGTNEMKQRKRE